MTSLSGLVMTLLFTSCGSQPTVSFPHSTPALLQEDYVSFDQYKLPYQAWLPTGKTKLIVIGFHGISGASDDLANLGNHLTKHLPGTAVYAPDLRGQGNDPITEHHGDIRTPDQWINDATTFTNLVRQKHPDTPVVWCGESMGSLIALHACTSTSPPPCDALILSSPVTTVGSNISSFRLFLLKIAAAIHPTYRLTLEKLAGVDKVQVTRDEVHQDQAATNPWHVSSFTLRLLRHLERLISRLSQRAESITIPTLILHGGKDIFSNPTDVERFASRFPPQAATQRHFYPESFHLLFYDHQRDQILADLTNWLEQLNLPRR